MQGILDAVTEAKTPEALVSESSLSEEPVPDPIPSAPKPPPYNLVLTTATIPSALNTHLLMNFPDMIRLASPKLHRLPGKMQTERVDIKGMGNPLSAIHKKLLEIFANQTRRAQLPVKNPSGPMDVDVGRVILFCNQSKKAEEVGDFLKSMKMPALVMTGASEGRRRGSNKHLEAFLGPQKSTRPSASSRIPSLSPPPSRSTGSDDPRVLITTSLLARGLDFSPSVSHVLIVDEPRNEVDFLHRAGRTGRAGRAGTVVVFGKGIAPRKVKRPGFA